MGWPHSPHHNVSYRIETAAKRAAQLLMQAEEEDIHRIKEGLALLSRYGLADLTSKLFKEEQREALCARREDVEWFRQFCSGRPTLPRAADAHFAATLCGLPLLDDQAIEAAVRKLVERTDAWRADRASEKDADLLRGWWETVTDFCQHLPEAAARQVLTTLTQSLADQGPMFRLRPRRLDLSLWIEQGFFLKGGDESRMLARVACEIFVEASKRGNGLWMTDTVSLVEEAASCALFGDVERALLGHAAGNWLNTLLAALPIDVGNVLQVVALIETVDPFEKAVRLASFVDHANLLVLASVQSGDIGLALHCATLVCRRPRDSVEN